MAHNSKLDKTLMDVITNQATACYNLTLTQNGDLSHGLGDFDIQKTVGPERITECQEFIKKSSLVILDGNFQQETIDCALRLCSENEVPVFYEPTDPKKGVKVLNSTWSRAVHYVSPNVHELCNMVHAIIDKNEEKIDASDLDDVNDLISKCKDLGRTLMGRLPNLKALIVTLGQNGVLLIEPSVQNFDQYTFTHFPVEPVDDIASVSGAGDCLSAGFIKGLLQGYDHETCVKMGIKAARLSLKSMDTVPETLRLEEIKA